MRKAKEYLSISWIPDSTFREAFRKVYRKVNRWQSFDSVVTSLPFSKSEDGFDFVRTSEKPGIN